LFPSGAECFSIQLRYSRRSALPHAWARGENLQRVAAELPRGFQSISVAPGDGGVDADSDFTIHPGWRQGFGLRFRAVFVFGIELRRYGDALFFGHAC